MTERAIVLSQEEGEPVTWPAAPAGLSTAAAAIPLAVVWQRLEQYINRRWAARSVVWYADGPGLWEPRLFPVASLDTAEVWHNGAWETVTLTAAPRGWWLEGGDYKLTATVGDDGTLPDKMTTAYAALAEYMAETEADGGATQIADGDFSYSRSANAVARAIFYSGAADMLRVYKKVSR